MNLFSVSSAQDYNNNLISDKITCKFMKGNKCAAIAKSENKMFQMCFGSVEKVATNITVTDKNNSTETKHKTKSDIFCSTDDCKIIIYHKN